jgi:hypothetical protein
LERDLQNAKSETEESEEAPKEKLAEAAAGTDKQQKAKRFILAAKLFAAPYAKELSVDELPLTDETHILIARYISEHESRGERIRPSELFELLDENSAEFNAILDLNYGERLNGETAERFFADSVKTLRLEAVERQIAECNAQYASTLDVNERKKISTKLLALVQKQKELKRK